MHQQTTAVDQPPFSVVFNTADNTLDGFDVSGVQGSSLQVIRNWQCPIHVGEISLNLLNNSKTNVFRPLRFKFFAFGNGDDDNIQKLPEERLYLEFYRKVSISLVLINELFILLGKDKNKLFPRTFDNLFTHMDKRCIAAVHAFGNNIMHVHDIPTFKATQFAPLLHVVWKKFPGDICQDTEPGCQAVCEDFAHAITKGTHNLWSHKFVLWVCNELPLD